MAMKLVDIVPIIPFSTIAGRFHSQPNTVQILPGEDSNLIDDPGSKECPSYAEECSHDNAGHDDLHGAMHGGMPWGYVVVVVLVPPIVMVIPVWSKVLFFDFMLESGNDGQVNHFGDRVVIGPLFLAFFFDYSRW